MVDVFSKLVISIVLPLSLVSAGCATSSPDIPVVQVRPVLESNNGNFDLVASQKTAEGYYKDGAFTAAYTAYKNLGALKDHSAVLGFADTALALSSLDGIYQDEARLSYKAVLKSTSLTDVMRARAQAGLVLLDAISANPQGIRRTESTRNNTEVNIMLALDATPFDPRLWNALGQVYDRKRNWISALESYVTALRLSHDGGYSVAPVQNNMGMSLMMQGRTIDALQKFEQAHMAHPDIQLYDNNYRLALILSDKLGQAVDGLEDMRVAQLYNDAGFIAQGQGDDKRARALYEKAISISPIYFEIAEMNLNGLS